MPAAARIEIVLPVYNEETALAASVRRLHDHLGDELPFAWRIVIADNASTDETPRIAAELAAALVLAQRAGLRIHEVPVDWIEDPCSSVDLVRTARADLRGVARMLIAPREPSPPRPPARLGPGATSSSPSV